VGQPISPILRGQESKRKPVVPIQSSIRGRVWAVKSPISMVPASVVDARGWEAGEYGSASLKRDVP
jgi:hypothetical protein